MLRARARGYLLDEAAARKMESLLTRSLGRDRSIPPRHAKNGASMSWLWVGVSLVAALSFGCGGGPEARAPGRPLPSYSGRATELFDDASLHARAEARQRPVCAVRVCHSIGRHTTLSSSGKSAPPKVLRKSWPTTRIWSATTSCRRFATLHGAPKNARSRGPTNEVGRLTTCAEADTTPRRRLSRRCIVNNTS